MADGTVVNLPDNYVDYMDREDLTNAIWNRILHDIFPGPEFIISPEYHFDNGKTTGRADLVVFRVKPDPDKSKVIVVFEGKKAGGKDATVADALQQATNCATAARATEAVLIVGIGREFRIAKKDAGDQITYDKGNKRGRNDTDIILVEKNLDRIRKYLTGVSNAAKNQ